MGGAVLKFDNSTLNLVQFHCSPHPYHLPNFMDVFAWSMPFVVEKINEMLFHILQPASKVEKNVDDEDPENLPEAVQEIARKSLTPAENAVVELVSRLAQHVDSNAKKKDSLAARKEAQERIRKKVRTVARMTRMFKTLRQENETVIRLKGVCPGHKLKPGLLLAGKGKLDSELSLFLRAQEADAENEIRPGRRLSVEDAEHVEPD